jgi:hypothetical protein
VSLLAPLVLLAGLAIAVPIALHLLHRSPGSPVVFPALRYLQRTERDHARRIRVRQLVVLLLRIAALALLTLAGARLLVRGAGAAHPPTAVVVVLDNSLSSARVVGEDRVLDRLKRTALAGIAAATPEDRIWVIRAGSPWEAVVPLDPEAARDRIADTGSTGARGDLTDAVRRARRIVRDAGLDAGEVHLISDLQATAFDADAPVAGDDGDAVPVLVAPPPADPAPNHYLQEPRLGGGLPPLAGRRTPVRVALAGTPDSAISVRLFVDGRVRAATPVRPGASALLPLAAPATGWIAGWVEADPDALRSDDRRWFAAPVSPPPSVAAPGGGHDFLSAALGTLEEGGRLRFAAPGEARVVLADAGAGLEANRPTTVVLPPTDPARLPALNRRLADAGIPWRYRAPVDPGGALGVAGPGVPVDLADVRVRRRYPLEPAAPGSPGRILARTSDDAPWAVMHTRPEGARALLLAHPLEEGWSTLPVEAAMIPFVEWLVAGFGTRGTAASHPVGVPLDVPSDADEVALPDGTRVPVDGTSQLRVVAEPGIYTVFRGDSVVQRVAANPPLQESILTPLAAPELAARLGLGVRPVSAEGAWARETFTRRQGREAWRPLVALALLLLVVEGWLAATGTAAAPPSHTLRTGNRRANAGQPSTP